MTTLARYVKSYLNQRIDWRVKSIINSACSCEKAPDYPQTEVVKRRSGSEIDTIVPRDVRDCVCDILDSYNEFASRKLSDEELDGFYHFIANQWWDHIETDPIAPETTLDGITEILKKNLRIVDMFQKISSTADPERIDKIELIETFFNMAHDNDTDAITRPCFRKTNQPYEERANWELKAVAQEVLDCLFSGAMSESNIDW